MEQDALIAACPSVQATKQAGRALAACLRAGDVVLLSGDLGAGKTQFVQGVAAGLGADETPISPTFNIVLTYGSGRLVLHHFDLYRLDEPDQLDDIGLREYLESGGVCMVEWAEKFPHAFDEHLAVSIRKTGDAERDILASAEGERHQALLEDWRAALSDDNRGDAGFDGASGCADPAVDAHAAYGKTGAGEPAAAQVHQPAAFADTDGFVLCFDTANEVVAVGLGALHAGDRSVRAVATREVQAHRASNTRLLLEVDSLLAEYGVARRQIACVCVGRGPGSFTGVRIAMATAKGVAQALGVGLVGVSSLDAVAWNAWAAGLRGRLLVVADAMRKEVYPAWFLLGDAVVERLSADSVVKADLFASELAGLSGVAGEVAATVGSGAGAGGYDREVDPLHEGESLPGNGRAGLSGVAVGSAAAAGAGGFAQKLDPLYKRELVDDRRSLRFASRPGGGCRADGNTSVVGDDCSLGDAGFFIAGDGLVKYRELFEGLGEVVSLELWGVTGLGLLIALEAAWRAGAADPLDARRHDPGFLLPVYTRLSDAEENERLKLAQVGERNLTTGVQDVAPDGGKGRATMHAAAVLAAPEDAKGVSYRPLDAGHVADVALLEADAMGTDAWSTGLVADELGRRDRTWWVAESDGVLVGYAGGLVVDGDLQVLKVAVSPGWRRRGVARELVVRVAEDARNLGASTCSLEVRASNDGAQAFYAALGLDCIGTRPRYYSDREDAVIMQGPLPAATHDVAGMELKHLDAETASAHEAPLILAIESSCDETAGAVVDGTGALLSDVVASQIDFHARFGGVVPEIASRKHIEAICGVAAESLETAGLRWTDLNAVAVTYAPGLVGALVVGVAFCKGAAWALDVPFIGVNHLEGHLYANKIERPDFAPPAVVSLVSGGNTMLVHMRGWGDYEILGETIDDAVGEAFDKVAKALGLGYPGGPVISRQAAMGNPAAIDFPRAMMHSHDLRFSLSGLKTAVVNHINKERQAGRELNVADICASFQQAVVDVQVAKAKTALQQTGAPTFCLGGGVAANPVLRSAYEDLCRKMGVDLVMPPLSSCGDNAGMIALVALDRYRAGAFFGLESDAYAHADLSEPY